MEDKHIVAEEKQPEPQELVDASFTYQDAKQFKELVKVIHQVIGDEVVFEITDESLKLREMDPSRVIMLILEIPKQAFDEWHVNQPGRFGINISNVYARAFKHVQRDEKTQFLISKGIATVNMKHVMTRVFKHPLQNPITPEPPLPKIQFTAGAKLLVDGVKKILRDIDKYCATMVEINRKHVTFAEIADVKQTVHPYHVTLEKGGPSDVLLDVTTDVSDATVKAYFSTDYLVNSVNTVAPLCEVLTIELATDQPMRITATHANANFDIVFYIAPRIHKD